MGFTIRNGRLQGVPYKSARCMGGDITPELIILHDTAGRLEAGSSVAWFQDKKCETSAHLVVERNGSVTQMVPFDRKAFHAGASTYEGRRYCNGFAIGIEIVSPGLLDKSGKAWFGPVPLNEPLVKRKTKEHGDGYWLDYTLAQIQAVKDICRALVAEYPECNAITTHWAVSPGRKIDPNPLFPLEAVTAYAFGEDEPETADVAPADTPPLSGPDIPVSETLTPKTMIESKTGNTALSLGGLGVAKMAAGAVGKAQSLSFSALLLALLQDPEFWGALVLVAGAAFIWFDRRTKMRRYGW